MLFSDRSIWTMVHGIGLGGAALLGAAAALFHVYAAWRAEQSGSPPGTSPAFAHVTALTSVMLWLAVLAGTYIVFPPYRATPPAGAADLSQFPRALLLANPDTAWLHAFAMEIKEHAPWIASMLATAVAFIGIRYPYRALHDPSMRTPVAALLAICFGLIAFASLLGVFVNKVAPLQ